MSYILGKEGKKEGCIFDAATGKANDKENLLLYRDSLVVVLLNRFPYANGHLLVGPARHAAELGDLSQEENGAIMEMLRESVAVLK